MSRFAMQRGRSLRMASGWANHTGRLGVCVGTTGPGAIHLMNGLYDAAFDGAPVVALTGLTFHDLRGVRYQQSVDTVKLMEPLTVYNEEVTGPGARYSHRQPGVPCRRSAIAEWPIFAISKRGRAADEAPLPTSASSCAIRALRSSSSWSPPLSAPPPDQLKAAAAVLNAGSRVAILAGQWARSPRREEVTQLRRRPWRKARPRSGAARQGSVARRQSLHHRRHPGDLGTAPSSWAMRSCDTVLILGSTMPWEEYYPEARAGLWRSGVDLKPDRLGLRYPVEIGLLDGRSCYGDAARTTAAADAKGRPRLPAGSAAANGRLEQVVGEGRNDGEIAVASAAWLIRTLPAISCAGRCRDFSRLWRQHAFCGALPAFEGRPATDRDRHAGHDGSRAFVRHCREARLSGTGRQSPWSATAASRC